MQARAEGWEVCSHCRGSGRGALLDVDGRQRALLDVEQAVGRGGRLDMAVVRHGVRVGRMLGCMSTMSLLQAEHCKAKAI